MPKKDMCLISKLCLTALITLHGVDKVANAVRFRKGFELRTPDRESVTRIQPAHLCAGPGRGVAGHDVECAHARVPLTHMLV